jgi:YegS/Rv2252/BmrU family lipid kinase
MTNRLIALITNPSAGGGSSRRGARIARFCKTLKEDGIEVELMETSAPHDALRLAQHAVAQGATDVVIHGGDGTVNEALQGLAGSRVRFAVWPGGTANVLARELGMPAEPRLAARIIAEASTKNVHVGQAVSEDTGESRFFMLMAGVGLDASIVNAVRPGMKRILGKAAFWYSGLGHLAYWQPEEFEVEVGGKSFPGTFAAIGKGSRYGGNLAVTPRARLEEPEFEVCVISSTSRLRFLYLLSHTLMDGLDGDRHDVKFIRATSLRVKGTAPVQVDGELIGTLPMSFRIADWTIEAVVPPHAPVTAQLLPVSQASRSARAALGTSFTALKE